MGYYHASVIRLTLSAQTPRDVRDFIISLATRDQVRDHQGHPVVPEVLHFPGGGLLIGSSDTDRVETEGWDRLTMDGATYLHWHGSVVIGNPDSSTTIVLVGNSKKNRADYILPFILKLSPWLIAQLGDVFAHTVGEDATKGSMVIAAPVVTSDPDSRLKPYSIVVARRGLKYKADLEYVIDARHPKQCEDTNIPILPWTLEGVQEWNATVDPINQGRANKENMGYWGSPEAEDSEDGSLNKHLVQTYINELKEGVRRTAEKTSARGAREETLSETQLTQRDDPSPISEGTS